MKKLLLFCSMLIWTLVPATAQINVSGAKEKAEAAAVSLGVRLGKPSNITINDWGGWSGWWPQSGWGYGGAGLGGAAQNVSQSMSGDSGEGGSTFAVGQISVSANVSVSFQTK